MSNRRITGVLDYSASKNNTRLFMVILADRAADDGFCWPGRADIAARMNLSNLSSVTRLMHVADGLGELYVHRQVGRSNQYLVLPGIPFDKILVSFKKRFLKDVDFVDLWFEKRTPQESGGVSNLVWGSQESGGVGVKIVEGGSQLLIPEPLLNPQKKTHNNQININWDIFIEKMSTSMAEKTFDEFLKTAYLHAFYDDSGVVEIMAHTLYKADWLNARLYEEVKTALSVDVGVVLPVFIGG